MTQQKVLHKPEWEAWVNMKNRCHRPTTSNYERYGGRGIRVCEEWRKSFMPFYQHVGDRPTPYHSIDRIDNNGHYEPGNVRWATVEEQVSNKRLKRNQKVTPEDARRIRADTRLQREIAFDYHTTQGRISRIKNFVDHKRG